MCIEKLFETQHPDMVSGDPSLSLFMSVSPTFLVSTLSNYPVSMKVKLLWAMFC